MSASGSPTEDGPSGWFSGLILSTTLSVRLCELISVVSVLNMTNNFLGILTVFLQIGIAVKQFLWRWHLKTLVLFSWHKARSGYHR